RHDPLLLLRTKSESGLLNTKARVGKRFLAAAASGGGAPSTVWERPLHRPAGGPPPPLRGRCPRSGRRGPVARALAASLGSFPLRRPRAASARRRPRSPRSAALRPRRARGRTAARPPTSSAA